MYICMYMFRTWPTGGSWTPCPVLPFECASAGPQSGYYYLYAFIIISTHPVLLVSGSKAVKIGTCSECQRVLYRTVFRINRKIRIILRVLRFICAKLEINCHSRVVSPPSFHRDANFSDFTQLPCLSGWLAGPVACMSPG